MFAAPFWTFWTLPARSDTQPAAPERRAPPVFIGDAVQPWAGETMLLSLLRQEAQENQSDP